MAPICTPGHTDPSQDLLEEVRAVELAGERWGEAERWLWAPQLTWELPG